jgi:glycerophosphoryl diester phosphodiesterase
VLAVRSVTDKITTAVLVTGTAPVCPAALAQSAKAQVYCPDVDFVDEELVRAAHEGGIRVVPWTVNDPADWQRLLSWGVDGITTDYPDRLAAWLQERGIPF